MTDNYEHYITRNIKAFYKRRLFSPIIYLLLLAILWLVFPLGDMLRPHTLKADETLQNSYQDKNRYVRTAFYDLRFTGYTSESHGQPAVIFIIPSGTSSAKSFCSARIPVRKVSQRLILSMSPDVSYRDRKRIRRFFPICPMI